MDIPFSPTWVRQRLEGRNVQRWRFRREARLLFEDRPSSFVAGTSVLFLAFPGGLSCPLRLTVTIEGTSGGTRVIIVAEWATLGLVLGYGVPGTMLVALLLGFLFAGPWYELALGLMFLLPFILWYGWSILLAPQNMADDLECRVKEWTAPE